MEQLALENARLAREAEAKALEQYKKLEEQLKAGEKKKKKKERK
jgi:hypothetical protein